MLISLGLIPQESVNILNTGVPISYIVMLLFLLIAVPLLFYKNKNRESTRVYILFSAILAWALISSIYSDYIIGYEYILYPILVAWLCLTLSFLYSKVVSFKNINVEKLITRLAYLLTGIFVLYAIWFSFNFSFSYTERLKGPLGNAATIHLIMLPVLAIHLGNVFMKKRKFIPISASIITFLTIIMTGSRTALICLVLLIFLLLFERISIKKTIIIGLISIFCYLIILNVVSTDRYQSFEDAARQTNLETSLEISTQSSKTLIFGTGYGTIWPWYYYENSEVNPLSGSNMINTLHGRALYHPHSLLLGVLTELGLIALIPLLVILLIMVKSFLKSRKTNTWLKKFLLIGLISSLPSFLVDLYLIKNWNVSIVWWLFLFIALSIPNNRDEQEVLKKRSTN